MRRPSTIRGQTTFASHDTVNHGKKEYVRNDFTFPGGVLHTQKIHTNTVEGYYSVFKRGMKGVYQHCADSDEGGQ